MPLIPYRPFMDLERFFSDDDLFSSGKKRALREPRMDIYEEDDNLLWKPSFPVLIPTMWILT